MNKLRIKFRQYRMLYKMQFHSIKNELSKHLRFKSSELIRYCLISLLIVLATISGYLTADGQTNNTSKSFQPSTDSLSLDKVINIVLQNHPSVKVAQEYVNFANAGIGLAKSGYFPNIDATASYTRLGPVQEMTLPGAGTFQLYPADNYAAGVNYYQTIFDFGKTSKNISFATENKNLNQ